MVAWLECHRVMEVIHHSKSATKPATVIDKHRAICITGGGGVDFLGSQWHQPKRLGTNDIALATLVAFGERCGVKWCEAQKGFRHSLEDRGVVQRREGIRDGAGQFDEARKGHHLVSLSYPGDYQPISLDLGHESLIERCSDCGSH